MLEIREYVANNPLRWDEDEKSVRADRIWSDVSKKAASVASLGLAIAVLLTIPGGLSDKLVALSAGICPQRPSHSYFVGGEMLPLEARMLGIFAGLCAAMAVIFLTRGRGLALPSAPHFAILLLPVMLMAADGLNATAHDLGFGALYLPDNALRLATGLAAGSAVGLLFLPVAAQHLASPDRRALRLSDYAILLAVLAVAWLAHVDGWSWAYYPLASFAIAGLVLTLALLNLALVCAACKRRMSSTLAILGLALAILELLALGRLRYALLDGMSMW